MAAPTGAHDERIMAVYRDTIAGLYRYVSSHCGGDRALAEDVTQETWLRAVREWRTKGPPDQPMAWLVTVARNLLTSYYRRRRPASIDSVPSADVPAAIDERRAAESAETTATVCHALARLPQEQAQLLEAFHFDDRPTSQIAQSFGLSERAVEGRLRRARQRLRRELESLLTIKRGSR